MLMCYNKVLDALLYVVGVGVVFGKGRLVCDCVVYRSEMETDALLFFWLLFWSF